MRLLLLGISTAFCFAAVASAQSTTRPEPLPADQMLERMLKPLADAASTSRPASRPSTEFVIQQGKGAPGPRKLVREGTEIYDRPGHLHKRDDGLGQEFVFDDDGSPSPIPNMIVLPDLKLMSMENAQAATDRNLHFIASGAVTEYKDHNYILLESGPDDTIRRTVPAAHSTTQSKGADEMLSDMLAAPRPAAEPAARKIGPMTDATSGAGAVAPGAPVLAVLREGSQIIDRVGRLTHSADGQQAELTLLADGAAMQDAPLVILPNLKLATMENSVKSTNKDLEFRVTGTITEYRGRNYVLLEKLVVVSDVTRQF